MAREVDSLGLLSRAWLIWLVKSCVNVDFPLAGTPVMPTRIRFEAGVLQVLYGFISHYRRRVVRTGLICAIDAAPAQRWLCSCELPKKESPSKSLLLPFDSSGTATMHDN